MTPLGTSSMLSPLAPVQGATPLSPIQPTSGMSSFGSPTRVPPPPTGSYNSTNNYGVGAAIGAPPLTNVLRTNGFNPGVTDLTAQNNTGLAQGVGDHSVRQTGWVADNTAQLSIATTAPPTISPDPSRSPRQAGMQVIDLTAAPYPPGYYPAPQNQSQSFPSTSPYPGANNFVSSAVAPVSASIGQPTNSTFVRSSYETIGSGTVANQPDVEMAARWESQPLPSTAPFPSPSSSSTNDDLQWRRPSPRF